MEEGLSKRMQGAEKALARLHEGVSKDALTEMEQDGLIQRFEFCLNIPGQRNRLSDDLETANPV